MSAKQTHTGAAPAGWLNRTVLGIGLASLFSDWAHEIATAVLPAFLATPGKGDPRGLGCRPSANPRYGHNLASSAAATGIRLQPC